MAFPTIPTGARVLNNVQNNTTATRTFPALSGLTKNAGDLLIAIVIGYQSSAASGYFSGWSDGFTEFGDFGSSSTMCIGVAYKWSTGSETAAPTVTQVATITGFASMFLLSIPAAHASTPPEAGSYASGTGAANPASFDPAGWAAEDTLWVSVAGNGETSTTGSWTGLATAPTNFASTVLGTQGSDAVGGTHAAVAFRQQNASAQDVGAWTGDTSNARDAAIVIAVRPAPSSTDLAPSPVAVSPAVPVPAMDLTLAFAPAPVSVTPAVPAPTLALSLAVSPSPVQVTPSVPVPALAMALALQPSPVAVMTTVPGSTLVVDQALSPAPVTLTLAVPSPALAMALAFAPAPIAALLGVTAPTLQLVLTLAPDPVSATPAVTAPTLALALNLAPAPVAVLPGVPASVLGLVVEIQPSPIAAGLLVPEPFVDAGGGDISLAPAPIAALLGLPAPALDSPLSLMPDPLPVLASVPASQLDLSFELAPAAVPALLDVPSPSLALIMTLAPEPVAAVTGVQVALLGGVGDVFLEPSPVAVVLAVPRARVRIWQGRFLTAGGEWISFARHD